MIYAFGGEGHGEIDAVPVLVSLLRQIDPELSIIPSSNTMRVGGLGRVLRPGQLSRLAQHAKNNGAGALVIIVDCDEGDCDDCCEKIDEAIQREYIPDDVKVEIVLILREWEAMFLTCVEQISATSNRVKFRGDVENISDADAENIRDAKGTISRMMDGQRYIERLHQPAFTACIDVEIFRDTNNAKRLLKAFTDTQ